MIRFLTLALLTIPLSFSQTPSALVPSAAPTAEAILDHFIEVTGGKTAYERVTSQIMEGTMTMSEMGISGTLKRYAAPPNFEYSAVEFGPIGRFETGVYNGVAWEKNVIAGARIKNGSEKDQALRTAEFHAPTQWRNIYQTVELAGTESVEGEECYKLNLTPKTGGVETQYYSKQSGLLRKTVVTVTGPMGEVEAEAVVLEYKTVNRIMFPVRIRQKTGPASIELTIIQIQLNDPIPAQQFEPPADVRALMK